MNCLTCELIRATMYAGVQRACKRSMEDIAASLSERFGERYIAFVSYREGRIYDGIKRASKLPPYTDHIILRVERK